MSEKFERGCPDCGERLDPLARRCACGWMAAGERRKVAQESAPRHHMTCTWHSGPLQCQYPVGLFVDGAARGWCIFHRHTGEGVAAARIAEESRGCPPEIYLERAKRLTYGDGTDNANVAALRARLRYRAEGGGLGTLAIQALGLPEPLAQDEPGSAG